MSETTLDLVKCALYYGEAPPRLSRAAEDAVAGLVDALAAAQRENARLREALGMISDHGWAFNGRHTYTINCDDAKIDPRKFFEVIESALRGGGGA